MLTVVKAKDRAQKHINPVNMKFSFTIDKTGTHFLEWHRTFGGIEEEVL